MTNNNSKTGLYLGIFAAISAATIAAILIIKGKKNNNTPNNTGRNLPTRSSGSLPPNSTPPIKTQQGGTDPTKSIIAGVLDALGLGGSKGSGKGGGGSGGISFGGGTSGSTTRPTQSSGSNTQSNTAWNSPNNWYNDLGAYVDKKTGEAYDKKGNYVGFINDSGDFLSYDKDTGGHIDSSGNLYDYEGVNIGYVDSDGEVHFTETLPNGDVIDIETGDRWDKNGNYLGFQEEGGDFINYNSETGEYFDLYGGIYNGDGEFMGIDDGMGGFIDVGSDEWNQYMNDNAGFTSDESYSWDTPDDSYFYARGAKAKNYLGSMFVSTNGKLRKKVNKKK